MEVLVGSTFRDRSNVDLSSRIGLRRCDRTPEESWSSVGGCSENEEEEEDDAASSPQGRWSDSFTSSLEDSLPIKRGLSNHYKGKSKSFGNLMEAKDLEKVESPLNKRRRLLIANKLRRRSSLSSFRVYSKISSSSTMPLLALQEPNQEDYKCNHNYDDNESSDDETSNLKEKRMKITNNIRDFMVHKTKSFLT